MITRLFCGLKEKGGGTGVGVWGKRGRGKLGSEYDQDTLYSHMELSILMKLSIHVDTLYIHM